MAFTETFSLTLLEGLTWPAGGGAAKAAFTEQWGLLRPAVLYFMKYKDGQHSEARILEAQKWLLDYGKSVEKVRRLVTAPMGCHARAVMKLCLGACVGVCVLCVCCVPIGLVSLLWAGAVCLCVSASLCRCVAVQSYWPLCANQCTGEEIHPGLIFTWTESMSRCRCSREGRWPPSSSTWPQPISQTKFGRVARVSSAQNSGWSGWFRCSSG